MKRWLLLHSCHLYLVHLSMITSTASNAGKGGGIARSSFNITELTTYNMNTTVYWSPVKHSETQPPIEYYVEFNDGLQGNGHWNSSRCLFPQWHVNSGLLSCLFLTCDSTELDETYEVRVRAGNSSNSPVTDTVMYDPTEENIPDEVMDVQFTASSSTEGILTWKLPSDFCMRADYCVNIYYKKSGSDTTKSIVVKPEWKKKLYCKITGLQSCSEYSFNVTVFNSGLCFVFIKFGSRTTGPLRITISPGVKFSSPPLHLQNFDAVVHWKQPGVCPNKVMKYNVYFKESGQEWSKSNCTIQEDKATNEFSCLFLTCETTRAELLYEVQVVNFSNPFGRKDFVLSFHPVFENFPDQITNVTVFAITSKSMRVSWETSRGFCLKFPYCARIYYHAFGESKNKSMIVNGNKRDHELMFNDLFPFTKYYFYVLTYMPILDCSDEPSNTLGSTGPFARKTLEAAPSEPPLLICGLCDVTMDAVERNGTVKWKTADFTSVDGQLLLAKRRRSDLNQSQYKGQGRVGGETSPLKAILSQLPKKDKWNGVPRVFMIFTKKRNESTAVWRNVTIKQKMATHGALTGLSLHVDYVVRVRMCNGENEELCSAFSEEVEIEAEKPVFIKQTKSSTNQKLALALGLPAAIIAMFAVLVFVWFKKNKCSNVSQEHYPQFPDLSFRSYENIENRCASVADEYCSVASLDCAIVEEDNRSTKELHSPSHVM